MTKLMVPALAVVAALAATNPSEDAHTRQMVVSARNSSGLLCGGVVALASRAVEYNDHLLFSTAQLGDSQTVGVLGKVLVVQDTTCG